MNVTPLVDVVLVLLIIFMVISPALVRQLPIEVPREVTTQQPSSTNNEALVVTVDRNRTIRINRRVVSSNQLIAELEPLLAARGDRTVFFDAESDAQYADAAATMDLLHGAHVSALVVSPQALPIPVESAAP